MLEINENIGCFNAGDRVKCWCFDDDTPFEGTLVTYVNDDGKVVFGVVNDKLVAKHNINELREGDKIILNRSKVFSKNNSTILVPSNTEVNFVKSFTGWAQGYIVAEHDGMIAILENGDFKVSSINIMNRIRTFEDAYNWCVEKSYDVYTSAYNVCKQLMGDDDMVKDIIAYLKLRIITVALNEGWKPLDGKCDSKWIPYIEQLESTMSRNSAKLNFFNEGSYTSNHLCFKSFELADYASKQFTDIYEDFYN